MGTIQKPQPGTVSSSRENRIRRNPRRWNIKKYRTHTTGQKKVRESTEISVPKFMYS